MCDPPRREQSGSGRLQIRWAGVKAEDEIAGMIKRHQHHDQSTQNIDRLYSLARQARCWPLGRFRS
jgi:hypothetical protein